MKIYHVVAMAQNRVIGKDNKLPWHFSADLKHFKRLTSGHTILMGRKTCDSIGKPLPNRQNFVISRTQTGEREGLKYFNSIEAALRMVQTERAFIIGGADIYRQTAGQIDGIYLTLIHKDYEGDASYPALPPKFLERSREKLQDNPLIEVIFYEKQGEE